MEKNVTINIQRVFKNNRILEIDETTEETVDVVRLNPEAPYGTIGTERAFTYAWEGRFCSATAKVWMEVPAPLEKDQQDQAYQYISDFCEQKMEKTLAELLQQCEETHPKLKG